MTSVNNSSVNAAHHAKKPEKSGRYGMHGGAAEGFEQAFGDMFSAMVDGSGRQDLAAAAATAGKASPFGLASEVLGPAVHIITTAATVTSDDSLKAFARSQGMDENALSLIFGNPPPATDAGIGVHGNGFGFGLSADAALKQGLGMGGNGLAGSAALDPALAKAQADAAAAQAEASATSLELGPEASLRWSIGQTDAGAQEKPSPQLMFGLNAVRAMLPEAGTHKAAQTEPAATPESAHQTLAASLILGASEASQFARRQQMKQMASTKADKVDKFEIPARFALAAGSIAAEAARTDEAASVVESLVLDASLSDDDAQLLWQHRQTDGRMSNGQQAGDGGSAAAAQRSNIDLRAEQYERLSERLAESLGQRLAAQIAKGDWKVEMALHPSELGNIDVKLNMNKGQLEASFSASQPLTQALIADGLPRLKEMLAQMGMEVASMQVNVRQQGQHGGNPTPRREPSGVTGVSSKRGDDGNATAATTPAPRSGGITNDGLDLLA